MSSYTSGENVFFNNKLATVTLLPAGNIVFSFNELDHHEILSVDEANAMLNHSIVKANIRQANNKRKNDDLLTVEDRLELARRQAYVSELKRVSTTGGPMGITVREKVIEHVKRKIDDPKSLSPAQLARWFKADQCHADRLKSTLPSKKRNRKQMFTEAQIDYVLSKFDQYLLVKPMPKIQHAYDKYIDDLENDYGKDAMRVSYETFNKMFKGLIWTETMSKTKSRSEFHAAKRNAVSQIITNRILERVEADAVTLAIGIVDEEGNYLGPATIYAVIDVYSRSILGVHLQVGRGENSAGVINCFKKSILQNNLEGFNEQITNSWPMFGLSEKLVIDGGAAYNSMQTKMFCSKYYSSKEVLPARTPWKKGFIERFFGTLRSQFATEIPGYMGKYNGDMDDDETIRKNAVITKSKLYELLIKWIVDEYHQTPHASLNNKTPHQVWMDSAQFYPPELPRDYESISLIKGDEVWRVIQGDCGHIGITINKIRYNDKTGRLKNIFMKLKSNNKSAEVLCMYDESDISSIDVVDPECNELFTLYAVDQSIYEGMCLLEYQVKQTKKVRNKGFGHKRVLKDNKSIENLRFISEEKKKKAKKHKRHISKEFTNRDEDFNDKDIDVNFDGNVSTDEAFDYE